MMIDICIDMSYDYVYKHGLRADGPEMVFSVDPRIWEISLVKPKNTRK